MSERRFIYPPLPPHHIRLLGRNLSSHQHKQSLSADNVDSYRLLTFPAGNCPPYDAISYCWGTQPSTVPCFLTIDEDENDGLLHVTPHLQEGLRNGFAVFGSEWLWVDAICITQDDDVEKAQQVGRMGGIFESARRVIVWLGGEEGHSESVMALMGCLTGREVLGVLRARERVDWEHLEELGVPGFEDAFWVHLLDLLHRPWFERLWIVQEVVLAREAVFLCGRRTVSWEGMKGLCTALRDGDLIRELGEKSAVWRAERKEYRSFRALDVVESVQDIKRLKTKRPWVAAVILLALIRKQISTEPLDYVYGILGLLPDSCRDKVIVDYSEISRKYYGRTYAQLFQALLEGMGDAALMFLNDIETPKGAPSWCPELRSVTRPGYSSFRVPDVGAGCNPKKEGYQTPTVPSFGLESADIISVKGAVFDTVTKVVRLVRPGKLWSYPLQYNDEDIVSTCMSFHQCKFATKELGLPLSALARTLTGQTTRTQTEDARFVEALEKTSKAFRTLSEGAKAFDVSALQPLLSDEAVITYTKLIWSHWNGRSFFTTVSGRIGLGLRSMRPGDSVCVFFGAPKPYIMRAGTSEAGTGHKMGSLEGYQTYKVVAECYIDNVMNGELFEASDFETLATTFYIN